MSRFAIGNPASVPAGRYAKEALQYYNVWDTLQPSLILCINVRQVLDYVSRGEVEAGIVYSTDAASIKEKVRVVQTFRTWY